MKTSELEKICNEVINEYPSIVKDYKNGKTSLIGFLTGEVMKRTENKANPKQVIQIIKNLTA